MPFIVSYKTQIYKLLIVINNLLDKRLHFFIFAILNLTSKCYYLAYII